MKIYAINLVISLRNAIEDKIAINKYPIIVKCKTESKLKEILSQESIKDFLKRTIKSQRLMDTAQWYIRCIYETDVREIIWDAMELLNTKKT